MHHTYHDGAELDLDEMLEELEHVLHVEPLDQRPHRRRQLSVRRE